VIEAPQAAINAILSAKVRRRTLSIPYRYGAFGELKRPPRIGSVHTLRAPSQYPQLREEASRQPTRARAVLWLIDRLEPARTVKITVVDVDEHSDGWRVHLIRGEHALDRPRLLKASSPAFDPRPHADSDSDHGYTSSPALALAHEPEAIGAQLLERYALEANARDLERKAPYTERDRQRRRRAKHRARIV
jgi:hypothetical protein